MGRKKERRINPVQQFQRKLKKKKRLKKISEKIEKSDGRFIKFGIDKLQKEHQKLERLGRKQELSKEDISKKNKIKRVIEVHFKKNVEEEKIVDPRERRRRILMQHSDINIEKQPKSTKDEKYSSFFSSMDSTDFGDKYSVPIVDGIPLPKEPEPEYNPPLPKGPPPMDNVALSEYASRFIKSRDISVRNIRRDTTNINIMHQDQERNIKGLSENQKTSSSETEMLTPPQLPSLEEVQDEIIPVGPKLPSFM